MSKTAPAANLLVCNCQRSMEIDGARLAGMLGRAAPLTVHTALCREQAGAFEQALATGSPVHVACGQEEDLFRELAAESDNADAPLIFTDIRDRAGWCGARSGAMPKMAALLAEAAYTSKPASLITLESKGQCLVYGEGQTALDVATALCGRLSVTLLLSRADDITPPRTAIMPISRGIIRRLSGHLGAFEIEVDGYAPTLPSSRSRLEFALARDGARSNCDLVLDLSGRPPLVTDHTRRDGYLRVDPASPTAVATAMLAATDLIGTFEKPLYVAYDAGICAHSRSQKVGCSRCLDTCPTGAITPEGDIVRIDPAICGGCGSCSAVCPTGAVSYVFPRREDVLGRARVLLDSYRRAGGSRPILLVHDEGHGAPLISAMARGGRGLPTNVLPLGLHSVLSIGHDIMAGLLVVGAERIVTLVPADKPAELAPLESEAALTAALLDALGYQGPRVLITAGQDPDSLEVLLHDIAPLPPIAPQPFAAVGGKRNLARIALGKLHEMAPAPVDAIALPAGAPYGRIAIRAEGCTLCLSCVGACPANALADNPDRPEVAFTEAACVQCGLCVATCPEKVITLEPRYDFTSTVLTPRVLHGEEPFHCVRCAKPFGTKASITRVTEQLKGHAMFQDPGQLALIQMCDTCRIETMADNRTDPLRGADRPRVRTTEDYLAAEVEAKRTGRKPEDFLS
jgi:ferredoxin